MAALRERHAGVIDFGRAGTFVRRLLGRRQPDSFCLRSCGEMVEVRGDIDPGCGADPSHPPYRENDRSLLEDGVTVTHQVLSGLVPLLPRCGRGWRA